MIHIVCGPLGAGKTTYAMQLAEKEKAIRFTEDEWLARLFVPDAPVDIMSESVERISSWATDKYSRCRGQIWSVSKQLIEQGFSVIFDGAAASKEQRDSIRTKAKLHNQDFKLHYVNAAPIIRKERALARNHIKGSTFSLEVTPEVFDFMETFFEPPIGSELIDAIVVNTDSE